MAAVILTHRVFGTVVKGLLSTVTIDLREINHIRAHPKISVTNRDHTYSRKNIGTIIGRAKIGWLAYLQEHFRLSMTLVHFKYLLGATMQYLNSGLGTGMALILVGTFNYLIYFGSRVL